MAIQQQVASGTIRLIDGRVDPIQADASWGVIRRARMTVQDDDAGRRSARAKIAVTLAKFRLAQEKFEALRDSYVDRSEAIDVARVEADYVLEALRAAPPGYAAIFATELGIEPAIARAILNRFIDLALAELGDLAAQAVRETERV